MTTRGNPLFLCFKVEDIYFKVLQSNGSVHHAFTTNLCHKPIFQYIVCDVWFNHISNTEGDFQSWKTLQKQTSFYVKSVSLELSSNYFHQGSI